MNIKNDIFYFARARTHNRIRSYTDTRVDSNALDRPYWRVYFRMDRPISDNVDTRVFVRVHDHAFEEINR
jgi:hypothetical protein